MQRAACVTIVSTWINTLHATSTLELNVGR